MEERKAIVQWGLCHWSSNGRAGGTQDIYFRPVFLLDFFRSFVTRFLVRTELSDSLLRYWRDLRKQSWIYAGIPYGPSLVRTNLTERGGAMIVLCYSVLFIIGSSLCMDTAVQRELVRVWSKLPRAGRKHDVSRARRRVWCGNLKILLSCRLSW